MENENNNYEQVQNQNPYQQAYGEQPYDGQSGNYYGQQPYGQSPYGQSYYGEMPMDKNGNPLKNRFGMKLTFAILEIICCNLISIVCGIIAIVNNSKANTAYQQGRWDEFKSSAKTATISLWIGFVGVILNIVLIILGFVAFYYAGSLMENSVYDYSDSVYEESYVNEDILKDDNAESAIADIPVEVVPGEGFTEGAITIAGVDITLPLAYTELETLGFSIDEEDAEYVLNKSEYDMVSLYDATEERIGYVYVGNMAEEPLMMREGVVFGFCLSADDVEFSFRNGFNNYATLETAKEAYGTPDDEYADEETGYTSCQWYCHSEMYEDMNENSLEMVFWDGKLDEVTIRYIGWE